MTDKDDDDNDDDDDDDDDDDNDDGNDDEYSETHQPPIQRVPGALSAGYCILLTNDNQV